MFTWILRFNRIFDNCTFSIELNLKTNFEKSEFNRKSHLQFLFSCPVLDSADDADDYNVGVILEYLAADWPIVFSADFKLFSSYGKTFDDEIQER